MAGVGIGKSHPLDLRSRVIAVVGDGHGQSEAARQFRVSPRVVNDRVLLKRAGGGLLPKAQGNPAEGNPAEGKLARVNGWLRDRPGVKGELTLAEIVAEIVAEMSSVHGVSVHGVSVQRGSVRRGSVGKWRHRLGLSPKENAARQRNLAARGGRAAKGLGRTLPA